MTDALLIRSAAVFRDEQGELLPGQDILVEAGTIASVGPHAEIALHPAAARAEVLDLGGLFVFPGLMNSHVHFAFNGTDNVREVYLAESPEERVARALENARVMALSGVTTARDCGSDIPVMQAMLAAAREEAILPNLLMCGPPITAVCGHLHYMGGEATTSDEVRALVRRTRAAGARSAKVMATGGQMTPGTLPEVAAFELAELTALVEEARSLDMSTVSHCLSSEGTIRSARAGFDSIEHCAFFERTSEGWLERVYRQDVTDAIRASGSAVMMGLAASTKALEGVRATGEGTPHEHFRLAQERRMMKIFKQMADQGIPMICGTDAGTAATPFDETWREIVMMVEAGLTPLQAIRNATTIVARAMRIDHEAGAIRAGLRADLIALADNPLENPAAFRTPAWVMVRGREILSLR
ncbi:Imidazolonepropionase-like amidohydrolase [Hyphomicrobiales bacterium]|nr:Imidazolonepropionase-like amidohydrolase [Hyphomicrobiales bacterium]CAH1665819.1 Imidazolonepropionase-like amidohydrolase [Hyphomicrobiales bacterium]